MAFFQLGSFLINSRDVSDILIEPLHDGYKVKATKISGGWVRSKLYEDYYEVKEVFDGIRTYLKEQEA